MNEVNTNENKYFDGSTVQVNLYNRVCPTSLAGTTDKEKADEYHRNFEESSVIALSEFLRLGARYLKVLEEIWKTDDKKVRSNLKRRNLPAASISALLNTRDSNVKLEVKLVKYNGIIVLDFDDIPNLEAAKHTVSELPYVWYVGYSASKKGFFAIIPTDNDDYRLHKFYFQALANEMEKLGLKVDSSCIDVTRLRFVSYDENPFLNEFCIPYSLPEGFDMHSIDQSHSDALELAESPALRRARAYVNEWDKKRIALDDYKDWYQMGMSLSCLGESGRVLFERISCFSEKYDSKSVNKQFDWFLKNVREIGIGTFFYKCHEYGVIPKGEIHYPIIPFPIHVLPEGVQRIIKETNKCLNFVTDHIASSLLFVASVAVGNSVVAEIKNEWVDKAILYMAIVGKPGTNKTAPLKYAFRPLIERDSIELEKYETLMTQFEEATKNANRSRGVLPEEPVYKQIVLSDFTTEVLMRQHKINPRGLTVYVDELIGFIKNFNKYRSGNDEQVWTQLYNGGSVIVNRMSSQPLNIKETFIGVIGTIQPGLLHEFAKGKTESGFVDRWLFSYPDESRYPKFTDDELPNEVTDSWRTIINKIFDIPFETEGRVIRMNSEAREIYSVWFNAMADQKNQASAVFAEVSTKMERYCIRFAIVLEALACVCQDKEITEISGPSIKGGIDLCYYYMGCAMKARKKFERNPVEELNERQKRIYRELPISFSTAEGLEIALANDMSERSFKEWLKSEFFKHISHGQYEKRYK